MWKIVPPLSNRRGALYLGGASAATLAKRFSTPLYVVIEKRVRENYRRIYRAFQKRYERFRVYYAVKANNNTTVLRILRSEGAFADCSCPEELEMARRAGFQPGQLMYTGNYNSDSQLREGCESGAIVNLDDSSLLPRLLKQGTPSILSFRINPGMGQGKFHGLVFGGKETKFGIEEGAAFTAYSKAKRLGVRRFGIHMMTGSCVLDENYFPAVTERLMGIAGRIARRVGISIEFVNIGGGFGIPYQPEEKELDIDQVARRVSEKFRAGCEAHHLGEPTLCIEPGRYLVGDAGVLLTRVTAIKRGRKTYVGVDAGMNTLLRPALYNAYHAIFLANRLNEPPEKRVHICGQVCENTDLLARDRPMPLCLEGDLFAILNAGAYGYAMSSNYNNRPRPAEVLVGPGGSAEIIREREGLNDLMAKMRIPRRFRSV